MALYRPPFAPYCQRQEANDPNPALRTPWDGCWAWTLARAINGATGGKVTCQKAGTTPEQVIRAACGNIDRPGVSDGGTLNQQVIAIKNLLAGMGVWYYARPTVQEFRDHLAAGGMAVMAGWESNAPASDRAYDPNFYDRTGANGHSNFCQGVGDGHGVIWGNPEKPVSAAEPVVTIDAAVHFCWPAQNGAAGRLEAILFKSVPVAAPAPTPAPTPTFNEVNMQLAAGARSDTVVTLLAQTNLRNAPSITAAIGRNCGATTPTLFVMGAPVPTNDVAPNSAWYPVNDGGMLRYVHSSVCSKPAAAPVPADTTPFAQKDIDAAKVAAQATQLGNDKTAVKAIIDAQATAAKAAVDALK